MSQQTALPGMAGAQAASPATVYLEVDGKPHPARDCHWIEIAPCGCIGGVSRAGDRIGQNGEMKVFYTGSDAFLSDRPKPVREYEESLGSTYKLITHQQYRDTYSKQMSAKCPHTPKWGTEPLPKPEGWAWQTTDRFGTRRTFRRHLVPSPAAGSSGMDKTVALCGKVESQWMWKGESNDLYDTVPCAKCIKRAPDAPAPAVVDVPTGGLL